MSIRDNILRVREALETAVIKAGRKPEEVELMAVSKTKPIEQIREAYDAGLRVFGENRVLEAQEKFALLPSDIRLEMIGHVQTNKVKVVVDSFNRVQTVDSLRLAEKLESRCREKGRTMEILLQLKTSGEESKTGLSSIGLLEETAGRIGEMTHLKIRGLMTIAPFTDDEAVVRGAFSTCREARDILASRFTEEDFSVLSMGMSSDYHWAVLEGATQVRIGSAIFGDRY